MTQTPTHPPSAIARAAIVLVATLALAPGLASAQAAPTDTNAAVEAPLAIDLPALSPTGIGARVADGRWRGGILFDEGFRSAIRLSAVEDQEIARTISDLTLGATVLLAIGVDAALVPALREDGELVWRAQLAHALALGVTMAGGELVKRLVGRARPYERDCADDPTRHGCDASDVFHSFYSLHSGVAFTSAGFSCSMHLDRGLYGDVAADATACGVSLALAATTGILRVVSDRHYLSDVLVGAALGFLVGYLMPLAMVPDLRQSAPGAVAPPPQTQETPVDGSAPIMFSIGGAF